MRRPRAGSRSGPCLLLPIVAGLALVAVDPLTAALPTYWRMGVFEFDVVDARDRAPIVAKVTIMYEGPLAGHPESGSSCTTLGLPYGRYRGSEGSVGYGGLAGIVRHLPETLIFRRHALTSTESVRFRVEAEGFETFSFAPDDPWGHPLGFPTHDPPVFRVELRRTGRGRRDALLEDPARAHVSRQIVAGPAPGGVAPHAGLSKGGMSARGRGRSLRFGRDLGRVARRLLLETTISPGSAPLESERPTLTPPGAPIMIRATSAAFLSLALVASASNAQDGPLRRAGRALDQTGKNIRANVETEVARGQINAQERDVLNRVGKRIDWDKQLARSTLRLEVQAGGVVILQGSVLSPAAKLRVVDLTENTTGVTSVVDQLAIVKDVKVIDAPATTTTTRVIETRTSAPQVDVRDTVITQPGAKVIVRP